MRVIEVVGVARRYRAGLAGGWRTAVRDVDLAVDAGEGVAILGPNGAGKSSLLLMIAGLRRPTAGTIRVTGAIGLVPERPALYAGPLARVLATYARAGGLPRDRVDEVLARLQLGGWADVEVDALSQGARQRAVLAQALLDRPAILLLDEPLTNLDPASARIVVDVLADERRRGATLVVATHQLAELAEVCGRVAQMRGGALRILGPTDQLLADLPCRVAYVLPTGAADATEGALVGETGRLRIRDVSADGRERLLAAIRGQGGSVVRVEPRVEALGAGEPA